ncbi:MAG: hypothetical protein FWE86_03830 [Oscillospiraceae bacterium]|nr:hypothetical protein [Oscillospiraceae bacterium]
MMNIFDIYIAFVSWGSGGKRRPVLILEESDDSVTAFKITTRYESKSEEIRANYFVINDWGQAGLDRQSYVDTNNTVTIPLTAVDSKKPIGTLSAADERRLVAFIKA